MGRVKHIAAVCLAAGALSVFGGCTNPVLDALKMVKVVDTTMADLPLWERCAGSRFREALRRLQGPRHEHRCAPYINGFR